MRTDWFHVIDRNQSPQGIGLRNGNLSCLSNWNMSEVLKAADVRRLLEHLGFVLVERLDDWERYRSGRGGMQSLVMDMSREQYLLDDLRNDLIRVGVSKDDVTEAYLFMMDHG